MARMFGTDGVRGIANEELTPLLAMHWGRQVPMYLRRKMSTNPRSWWVVIPEFPEICWRMR